MPLQLADVFGRVMVEHGCCVLKIGGIVVSILHFCGRDGCRSLPISLFSDYLWFLFRWWLFVQAVEEMPTVHWDGYASQTFLCWVLC